MASLARQAGEPAVEGTDRLTSKAMHTRRAKDRMLAFASSEEEAAAQRDEVMVHTDRAARVSKVRKDGRGVANAATRDEADEQSNSGLVLLVGWSYCWICRIPP
jgi:3-hydroxyisobutyrate dehydrogenase-like beta-hydroxyacid dehydrogenase